MLAGDKKGGEAGEKADKEPFADNEELGMRNSEFGSTHPTYPASIMGGGWKFLIPKFLIPDSAWCLAPTVHLGDDAAMKRRLPPGKVPWELVAELVSGELPPEVLLGPAAGEDAALLEIGGELWAVASDPISFTAADAGRLAVIVNANDVAVRGARPQFFLAVVLISPHEAFEERVSELLTQVRDTCEEVGCVLIGGHTEVSPGLLHSVVAGTMLGRVLSRPLTTGGLRDGDLVGMTRQAGLEGTAILISEHGERLRNLHGPDTFAKAEEILAGDWLLVAPLALLAAACTGVTALHDVTEGGVGEALHEMAVASGLSIVARRDEIPVLPETTRICDDLGIDPLGLIGSGSLLVGCGEAGKIEVETAFAESGVPFAWIGRAGTSAQAPSVNLPRFPRDELLKASAIDGIRAVIFDMDGTLVDSTYDWPAIRQRLEVTGSSIIDDLNALPEPDRSRRWAELESFEDEATDRARLRDGAVELLELLAAPRHLHRPGHQQQSAQHLQDPRSIRARIRCRPDPRLRPVETLRRARHRGRQTPRHGPRALPRGRRFALRHPRGPRGRAGRGVPALRRLGPARRRGRHQLRRHPGFFAVPQNRPTLRINSQFSILNFEFSMTNAKSPEWSSQRGREGGN